MNNSPVYQILEFIRDNYNVSELDILEEFIEDKFPSDWEKFKSDNYSGPNEVDYDAPTQAERNEMMHRIQRDIK